MSLKTGGLQEYRRITPMALFAWPQRMQASPGSA